MAQVPLHHDAPVGGREQGLPVADHDRVVIHVQDASLGVDLQCDLVHRPLGGQPDADIEELVDAGFTGQEPDDPSEEPPVLHRRAPQSRNLREHLLRSYPVGLEVVLAPRMLP